MNQLNTQADELSVSTIYSRGGIKHAQRKLMMDDKLTGRKGLTKDETIYVVGHIVTLAPVLNCSLVNMVDDIRSLLDRFNITCPANEIGEVNND